MGTAADQLRHRQRLNPERAQLRHRLATPGHDEPLAPRDAINHITPVIAEIPDRHVTHTATVSPVRQLEWDLDVDALGRGLDRTPRRVAASAGRMVPEPGRGGT